MLKKSSYFTESGIKGYEDSPFQNAENVEQNDQLKPKKKMYVFFKLKVNWEYGEIRGAGEGVEELNTDLLKNPHLN